MPSTSSALELIIQESLDTFASEAQKHAPQHASTTQTVVNAVKAYAASLKNDVVVVSTQQQPPTTGMQSNPSTTTASLPPPPDRETALASLLGAFTSQMIDLQRVDPGASSPSSDSLATQLRLYREDVDVIDAYRSRIIELQKVINGTKLPGELSGTMIEPSRRMKDARHAVGVGVEASERQQQDEALHSFAKNIMTLRDKLDREQAENLKWSANVAALLGENSMLTDRVRLLETEAATLAKHNGALTKELTKARLTVANGTTSDSVIIGGVLIDMEVALWIKDVYVGLSEGKETNEVLQNMANNSHSSSLGGSKNILDQSSIRSLPVQREISSRQRQHQSSSVASSSSGSGKVRSSTPFAEEMANRKNGK